MSAGESGERCAAARSAPAAGPDPRPAAGPGPTPTGADRGPGPHRPQMAADRGRSNPAPTCSRTAGAAPERRSARDVLGQRNFRSGPRGRSIPRREHRGGPPGGGAILLLIAIPSGASAELQAGGAGGLVGPWWGREAPGHAAASDLTRCRPKPPGPVLQAAVRPLVPQGQGCTPRGRIRPLLWLHFMLLRIAQPCRVSRSLQGLSALEGVSSSSRSGLSSNSASPPVLHPGTSSRPDLSLQISLQDPIERSVI